MGFLDDLGKSLNKVGQKTSEMANEAKLKLEITKNKSNIDKKYEELGARIYFLAKENMEPDESVATIIEEIDQLFLNIANLEKELSDGLQEEEAVESNLCKNCGAALAEGVKFCGSCGAQVEEESKKLCPNCGAEVGESKFCNSCGTSLE
ncbi:zinc ribbon domain-containing protein [Acidaminobacter sp. JC074]|uniref:zinc ribbon domain-containing protein n=1 Tax=Acidaminobacter sp. JC074 TaxID=2530199 RepID=UPI001F0ECF4B|nr:zinc ribbon domain-containing protein [Acidaminobacter sp. JC074]MCH4886793.1 zinc ribbon domain-containing protein [Acidaminobacter sp. JC074]